MSSGEMASLCEQLLCLESEHRATRRVLSKIEESLERIAASLEALCVLRRCVAERDLGDGAYFVFRTEEDRP